MNLGLANMPAYIMQKSLGCGLHGVNIVSLTGEIADPVFICKYRLKVLNPSVARKIPVCLKFLNGCWHLASVSDFMIEINITQQ